MRKGFTLIELLAVIIILAIVALIATPIILNIIEDAEDSTNLSQAYMILDGAEHYYTISKLNNENQQFFNGNTNIYSSIETTGKKPTNGKVSITSDGKIELSIFMDDKCYKKNIDSNEVYVDVNVTDADTCAPSLDESGSDSDSNGEIAIDTSGANEPKITNELIPVIIANNGKVTVADTTKPWYNYDNKQWANAIILQNGSTVSIGDVLEKDDSRIKAYYVWIPRYEYIIFNPSAYSTVEPEEIEIKFVSSNEQVKDYNGNDMAFTHPAFTVDDTPIDGFWVGKFELTANSTILPNVASSTNLNIYTLYSNILKIGQSVENVDSHMLKNMEWGAVTYLSHSMYGTCANGVCSEVAPNLNSNYVTGCGINSTTGSSSDVCENAYGTAQTYPQSTTGNITGVFDMSGGTNEYVMGVMMNQSGTLPSYNGQDTRYVSGFSNSSIPNEKYYDEYSYSAMGQTEYYRGNYGEATRETIDWYEDTVSMPTFVFPWVVRGASSNYSTIDLIGIFAFATSPGSGFANYSTRAALWVE